MEMLNAINWMTFLHNERYTHKSQRVLFCLDLLCVKFESLSNKIDKIIIKAISKFAISTVFSSSLMQPLLNIRWSERLFAGV